MISTGSTDVAQVMQLGQRAKAAINKHYRLLEIDIDGVFASMLLLKKKKYAAMKLVQGPAPGSHTQVCTHVHTQPHAVPCKELLRKSVVDSGVSTAELVCVQTLETKGIDIVRRDWCQLSRDIGQACLKEILSGRDQEDIVEAVHELLRTVHEHVSQGRVELKQFVITKQLTKNPEDYPDAKNQAHVQVTPCAAHTVWAYLLAAVACSSLMMLHSRMSQ